MIYRVVSNKGWKSEPFWASSVEKSKEIGRDIVRQLWSSGVEKSKEIVRYRIVHTSSL